MGGGGGGFLGLGGSAPKPRVTAAPTPTVAATPPPVEETAQAPITNEAATRRDDALSRRKGTSALKIALSLGGVNGGNGLGSLNIPT